VRAYYPFLITFIILFIDQSSKLWIKLNMNFNDHFNVLGDWFKIMFIENEGMAFGLQIGGADGKLFLTIFRLLASAGMVAILYRLIKLCKDKIVLVSGSLLLAGTLGNVFDSVFYGVIFSSTSHFQKAVIFPTAPLESYSTWLYGNVVDMLYFPIAEGQFPSWFPERPLLKPWWCPVFIFNLLPWANETWLFFRPIFNIADTAISLFMFSFILFQKRFSEALSLIYVQKK